MTLSNILAKIFNVPPSCPLTDDDRVWIEDSFGWAIEQFGANRLRDSPVITPTAEYFPDSYTGADEEVEALFRRICGWMGIDPATIDLHIYTEDEPPELNVVGTGPRQHSSAAGLYWQDEADGTIVVALEDRTLDDPVVLVSTIAHELGHVLLLSGKRISASRKDHEPLTDLVAIFCGLGVFTANSAFSFSQWSYGNYQGWNASKCGYLPEPMLGYSLAAYAWLRGEVKAPWRKFLAHNVGVFFDKSIRYLSSVDGGGLASVL